MLTFPKLLKIIRYNFARKVKNIKIDQSNLVNPSGGISQIHIDQDLGSSIMEKKAIQQSVQQMRQLAEQFEPISQAAINVQKQKLRQAAIKELSYDGEDPNPNKLVNRPAKGVVWGLGGQLVLASRKVQLQGVRDDPEQIAKFLELHQVKNIYIHDWSKFQQKDLNRRRYSIIGSCFSARHCWKTGIQLKNALNRHMLNLGRQKNNKLDAITAVMVGRKSDEWSMVEYKDFQISLMTQEQREAVDLQYKWNNPVPEEVVQKHIQMTMNKKKRRSQFQDFD